MRDFTGGGVVELVVDRHFILIPFINHARGYNKKIKNSPENRIFALLFNLIRYLSARTK